MGSIGKGHITIERIFPSDEWRKFDLNDVEKWNAPIPAVTSLYILGFFELSASFWSQFKLLSFELMTNFAAADFAGKSNMRFTDIDENQGRSIIFRLDVPLYPTKWTPEAIVKLHFVELETGTQYTAYFKCKLGEVVRSGYGGFGGMRKYCEKPIPDPHADSAESASLDSMGDLSPFTGIPTPQHVQESLPGQGEEQDAKTVLAGRNAEIITIKRGRAGRDSGKPWRSRKNLSKLPNLERQRAPILFQVWVFIFFA